jgi:hypothetical protein
MKMQLRPLGYCTALIVVILSPKDKILRLVRYG